MPKQHMARPVTPALAIEKLLTMGSYTACQHPAQVKTPNTHLRYTRKYNLLKSHISPIHQSFLPWIPRL
ncbi:hypothetical protein EUGRSUZ_F03047 [Eucalyptus grandis]|uniref:Uncharacterized protein n=2 Tax=Eucalyptus grandis TaxID=71139 RepID=A0ACC3KJN1_EUCGR|nr:hypothetical protein EUGRSUZ_F03047 [Eucalyptus grandis]